MAKQIKGKEIIESDHLADARKSAESYLKVIDKINSALDRTAKLTKQGAQSTNLGNAQDIQKLNAALLKSEQTKKAAIETDKQALAIQKQLKAATDEEVKAKIRYQDATQKQKKDLKDLLVLESKESGTLEKLAAKNRQLRREREGLNLSTEKGKKRLIEINRALDRNNAKIRANSDAMKKQRLNVGNYGSALSRVGGILKGFGATLLATFSIRAVGSFFKNSINNFRVQEKAVKKVEQAIKSTGGAAGRTSEELQKMASSLQENSLFGDEQILNEVTAQLLTFTNIGNEQFDRTQQVALDLATVLDGDLKSASIQLGKALNDPIANLSALSRSGIQFSKEQKDLIKTLTETGRLADAQNVILGELERQYGGQAKAAAEADGGIQQLKNTFGDMQEIIGGQLIKSIKPVADDLKEFIQNLDPEDVKAFADGIANVIRLFVDGAKRGFKLIATVSKLGDTWGKAFSSVDNFKAALSDTFSIIEAMIPGLGAVRRQLEAWAKDLGLISNETKKLTEEQKRNNAVRSKSVEVTRELLKANEDEMGDIPILIDALQDENTTREEKQEIIEKLQADYPDLIKNIDLETASTEQLTQVKKDLIKQLFEQAIAEKKAQVLGELTAQILEKRIKLLTTSTKAGKDFLNQEIKNLEAGFALIDEIDQELRANLGSFVDDLDLTSPVNATGEAIRKLEIEIAELEKAVKTATGAELESLQETLDKKRAELARYEGDRIALLDDGLDKEKGINDESVSDLKKTNKEKEKETRRFISEIKKIIDEGQKEFGQKEGAQTRGIIIDEEDKIGYDDLVDEEDMELIPEKTAEIVKKSGDEWKKLANTAMDVFKQITDSYIAEMDRRIEANRSEIADSESNISRLQTLAAEGNVDAAEAIKAERLRIAQEKLEIEKLEKRKRNLLIIVTALEKANMNFQQGDANGFANASQSMQGFLSGLPQFSEGTIGTIADALGRTNTTDGHVVRVDDKEHILSVRDSERLHRAGLRTNKDIVSAAMSSQNKAIYSKIGKHHKEDLTVKRLERIEKAILNQKPVEIVQQHIDFQQGMEVIRKGNKTIKNNYKGGLKI